ncbi:MAG: signal peptidase I [Actinomycetota bacterium]|nr:signal peptidase I [Actinomycetota bacterium]
MRGPIDRLTERLPPGWRTVVDWALTIAVAVGAVLAIKAWVVNPYRIPSPSMEPALHCGGAPGCEADFSDRVLANRFIYHFRDPKRREIVVFRTPPRAVAVCESSYSTTFVKRLIALPGETWEQRRGVVYIDGRRLVEPYLDPRERDSATYPKVKLGPGQYFMMGDNRAHSCDSRKWGPVPRKNLIGEVFAIYWPPQRIGIR